MHWSVFCALTCAGAAAQAQGNPDLMRTPECLAARKQLDQVLEQGGPRDRLDDARQQAALKCLGVKAAPLPEGRFVPPPVAVDPIRLRAEPSLPPVANRPVPGPAAVQPAPPVSLGPRGICTEPAGALNCP